MPVTAVAAPPASPDFSSRLSVPLRFEVRGVQPLIDKLTAAGRDLTPVMQVAMSQALSYVARQAATKYLSGPRPQFLGVKTNYLRSSLLNAGRHPDGIFEISARRTGVTGRVGTMVKYAAIHEHGGTIQHPGGTAYIVVNGVAVFMPNRAAVSSMPRTKAHPITIPPRPFLRPVVSDPAVIARVSGIFRSALSKALKEPPAPGDTAGAA